MTEFLEVKNNAVGALLSGISNIDTLLTLRSSEGTKFPSIPSFQITVENEIIKVGGISGDQFSPLTRAQEGTTAVEHGSGAAVELRLTAKLISDLNAAVNTLEESTHAKYLDSEAVSAVPFVVYISFGSEPISGQSFAP